jgi:hypothetical protein
MTRGGTLKLESSLKLWKQREFDLDSGIDFDRFAVQQSWLIPPLAHRFDSRPGKVRVNLAV